MIYKLPLNEDIYSNNTIRELTRMIRSSLSGYVENVSDVNSTDLGFNFEVTWDSTKNQDIFIEITDEHDIIGLTPIEFYLYIGEDEYGPFCYHSSEKACREAKDFILDILHDKFTDVSESVNTKADNEDEIIYIVCFDEDGQNMDANFTDKVEAREYAFKYIDFGPVLYEVDLDGNLLDTEYIGDLRESTLMESTSLDRFLKSKVVTVDSVTGIDPNCIKRSLMPRGCYFKSSSLLGARVVDHGTIHWQGTDYVFRVKPDGTVVVMTETQAGSNWSETIFKEALERDNDQEEDLNEFAYRIDDLKQFYNTATSIDKNKYPNFFAWYDAMTKEGKLKNSQITA